MQQETSKKLVQLITKRLGKSPDFSFDHIKINDQFSVYCLYISSLVSKQQIDDMIMKPIVEAKEKMNEVESLPLFLNWINFEVPMGSQECLNLTDSINDLLDGKCLIVPSYGEIYFSFNIPDVHYRNISEPQTEASIRGPREGFVEDVARNVSLIRKRLKNEHLILEAIIAINILLLICFKLSLLFYCAVLALCQLFNIKRRAVVAFPLVWVISAYSLLFKNIVENVEWIQKYLFNYYLVYSIFIPMVLIVLTWFQRKHKFKRNEEFV